MRLLSSTTEGSARGCACFGLPRSSALQLYLYLFFYILSSPKRAKHCLLLAFHAQFLGLTPALAAILLPAAGVSSALVLSPPKPEDPAAAPMFLQKQKDSFGVCYPSLWQEKILGQGF